MSISCWSCSKFEIKNHIWYNNTIFVTNIYIIQYTKYINTKYNSTNQHLGLRSQNFCFVNLTIMTRVKSLLGESFALVKSSNVSYISLTHLSFSRDETTLCPDFRYNRHVTDAKVTTRWRHNLHTYNPI